MPSWININERKPINLGNYYVKISGRKDIIDLRRLCEYEHICDDVYWLDEKKNDIIDLPKIINSTVYIPEVPRITVENRFKAIKNIYNYDFDKCDNLEKLFGIKIGDKLERMIFKIKDSKIKNRKI